MFFRLVERADVVVENFRPGVKYRLGIDPDAVWAVNPRVVYASISGFGQTGPYADRPGVDQIAQGLGGLMSVTGPPGSGPWRVGIAISDTAAGTLLTQGVLAALHRARSHRARAVGAHVAARGDGELHGLPGRPLADRRRGAGAGGQPAPDDGADGRLPDRRRPPQPRRDGRLPRLLRAHRRARDRRRPALRRLRVAASRTGRSSTPTSPALLGARPTAEWVARLAETVPCGPVLAVDEVFADPQVEHLHLTRRVEHPTRGEIDVLRPPLTFSDTPARIRSGPPADGAHTREVLAELGYDSTRDRRAARSAARSASPRDATEQA